MMMGFVGISLLIVCSCVVVDGQGHGGGVADSQEDLEAALNYLSKYQGLPMSNDPNTRMSLISHTDLASTIRNMQLYMNVPLTGRVDAATKTKMTQPRCGVPDPTGQDAAGHALGGRMRRYTHTGGKWENPSLTFRILNTPPELRRREAEDAIRKAFKVWEDVTPLKFTEIRGVERADIYLKFGAGAHGDLFPFDGPGLTLAHAFPPQSGWDDLDGDVHFDDDETFTVATYDGTNLFQVAAHEIGHSLGLGHSSDSRALMAPFYPGYIPDFQLHYDDQLGIQRIYGSKRPPVQPPTKRPQPGPDPGPSPGPDPGPKPGPTTKAPDGRCKKTYDAITLIRGELFAFQNDIYWRLRFPQELISRDTGELTSHFWQAFPNKIDAAYERYFDHMIFFFKGTEYYKYNGLSLVSGYPKPIKSLDPKLPGNLDAVIGFPEYSKTYFIKGRKVWRFDELEQRVDDQYPINIKHVFPGVPSPVSSAFMHKDGVAYFLKGYEYYRYNDTLRSVDGPPRRFGVDFLGCDPNKLIQLGLDSGNSTGYHGDSNIIRPSKTFTLLLTVAAILHLFHSRFY
ncbi:collagenase 3-like [Lytechinus pictus]|uniref:collagenase 3-like n=1 Tax=Lytechinus pictus TaxID=7653 RepID=UPI0030BA0F32